MTDRVNQIIKDIVIQQIDSVSRALERVKGIVDLSVDEKMDLAKTFSDVFYHAHHTGSTQYPKLAVTVEGRILRFGPEMIPFLFNEMRQADSESSVYFGQTLARNGAVALQYILAKLRDEKFGDGDKTNIIQTLSFFKIPEVVTAIPLVFSIARESSFQVTSMALYTVGRLGQRIAPAEFGAELRTLMFEQSFRHLSNTQGLVRKNAARTLGKMMRRGLLSEADERKLQSAFLAITGRDENNNWDRSFIVRREAEDFLPYFHQPSSTLRKYNQSYRILTKHSLTSNTFIFTVEAPFIAKKIEAGQFIIVRPHIFSERIPLSVCGWDRERGTVSIIVAAVGKTTTEINSMQVGEVFQDVVGPLGERSITPSSTGTCVVVGGGYGTGAIIPTARDLKAMGNKVIGIVGARDLSSLIMTNELSEVCDEVLLTTNDGSVGLQGMVTDALKKVLKVENVIYILAVGPVPMMKAVSELTRPEKIPTYVSLNAIMVDGTGMCGACRVTVGGETKFACFHGPDFDGHQVDFENLMKRQKMFVKEEKQALDEMKAWKRQ